MFLQKLVVHLGDTPVAFELVDGVLHLHLAATAGPAVQAGAKLVEPGDKVVWTLQDITVTNLE